MFQFDDIKELLKSFIAKAELSFKKACRGKEEIKILIRYWAIPSYIFFFFGIDSLVVSINFLVIDLVLSSFAVIFFSWHMFAMIKCKPKKKKLTTEEKKELKKNKRKNLSKSVMKKLLLQESITKWDPVTLTIVADFYFFILFLGNII